VIGEVIFDGDWPVVEDFDIVLNMTTPTGEWYYEGIPEGSDDMEGDDDDYFASDNDSVHSSDSDNLEVADTYHEDREARASGEEPVRLFRNHLAPRFDTFLLAMGRAAKRMPRLKRLSLQMRQWETDVFQVLFFAEGMEASGENEEVRKKRWWYITVDEEEWKLSPEVRTVLLEAAGPGV